MFSFVMKTLLTVLVVVGFGAASAFAGSGSCGGCGSKKEGEKGKDSAPKSGLTVTLSE